MNDSDANEDEGPKGICSSFTKRTQGFLGKQSYETGNVKRYNAEWKGTMSERGGESKGWLARVRESL